MLNYKKLLKEKNISILTLSKVLNIPYASVYAIVNDKVKIENCKFSTVQKLSVFFDISLDDIYLEEEDFQTFRNNIHHQLKYDELKWYNDTDKDNLIHKYLLHSEYEKAVYLMALIQYIEDKHNIKMSSLTKKYKTYALKRPLVIKNVTFADANYIPEFEERNILEGDLYDAI